jgi:hypothetical protein
MASGGSISQMIQTIRFNKTLLSNRRAFGELKEHINRRIEKKAGLTIPEIDPELLKEIKRQIKVDLAQERKRNNTIIIGLILFGTLLMLWLVFSIYTDPIMVDKYSNNYEKDKAKRELTEQEEHFNYYIADGNQWLEKNEYHNAIFQFDLAIQLKPENYSANLGMCKSLIKQCLIENVDCEKSDRVMIQFLKKFEKNMTLRSDLSEFALTIGDTLTAREVLNFE